MRTDVKIALVASIVLIILVVVYIALIKHPRKTVMQNTEASSAPPLVQSNNPAPAQASSVSTPPLASSNSIGGAANVPATNPIPIPAANVATATAPATSTGPASTSVVANTEMGKSTGTATAPTTNNSILPANSQVTGGTGLNAGTTTANTNGMSTGSLNSGATGTGTGGTGVGGSSFATSSANRDIRRGYYRIRRGDTLGGISRRLYGTPSMVTAIEAANPGVSARDLRIGEKIRLPRKPHHLTTVRHPASYHPRQHLVVHGGRIYVVHRGDTLYSIAKHVYHNGADWKVIYRANRRKIGANPSDIFGGERLIIPSR